VLDLQKLTLRRLLETKNSDLYSKLSSKYFTGTNIILYGKIEHFYRSNLRIPSVDEFSVVKKEPSVQDYFDSQILSLDNINDNIQDEFLITQLQDYCIREETIEFLTDFIDNLDNYEGSEIMDKIQNHLLDMNKAIPDGEELIDVGLLEVVPQADTFEMFNSGLSAEYDNINGGFALQELVCLGGMRGSGKSILALNAAFNRFKEHNSTSAFFSIEMRYLEVYYRMMSIISNIPFLDFMRNKLSNEQKLQAAKSKMDVFYKDTPTIKDFLRQLELDKDIATFDKRIKVEKPEMKENRFFIIDDPALTLNRIDHYCNRFTNKYPRFTMATVDYLNIISVEDSKDWKTQITVAEALKKMARKYNITMMSPYQVDATLEARYAKGILDSADRAFVFQPKKIDEENNDIITLYTAKVRNGRNITFDVGMDWECTKIDPSRSTSLESSNSKLLKGTQNGRGKNEENSRDV
jgi:replicative DNA helicase